MIQPLPHLSKPEFILIPIDAPPEVPTQIAVDLKGTGIPGGLIGYEYRPLSEPVYVGGIGERGLVAIATSGLFGRIAVDVATGHVVQIPKIESATASHVNSDLDSFNRCAAAVIECFPFYAEDDEEGFEEVAKELRDLISAIDETLSRTTGSGIPSATTWRSETMRTGMSDTGLVSWFAHPQSGGDLAVRLPALEADDSLQPDPLPRGPRGVGQPTSLRVSHSPGATGASRPLSGERPDITQSSSVAPYIAAVASHTVPGRPFRSRFALRRGRIRSTNRTLSVACQGEVCAPISGWLGSSR